MKILLPRHKRSKIFKEQNPDIDVDIKPMRLWGDFSDYDLVVPLSFDQIDNLNKLKLSKSKSLIPNNFAFQLCNNKLALNSYLIQNGMKDNIPELFPREFPMILKPNIGISSKGVRIIRNESEYRDLREVLKYGFYQEYIDGTEYSINCVISENKVKFAGNYNYCDVFIKQLGMLHHQEYEDRVKSIENGENILVQTSQKEIDFIEQICRIIDYGSGILHFSYRMKGETIQLIEINPRWSGSSMFFMREMINKMYEILK